MPPRPKPATTPVDDSAGIPVEDAPPPPNDPPAADPEPEAKVLARYVGIEPVLAHIDGEAVIIAPGDQIPVSAEQLEQNPVFVPWED